jgi:hypothetical protein
VRRLDTDHRQVHFGKRPATTAPPRGRYA